MIYGLFAFIVTTAWTAVLFGPTIVAAVITLDAGNTIWFARTLWSPVLLALGRGKLEVIGQENVDPKRPTVYVSNHQSTVDIPVLFMALPVNFRYVAKSQLKYVPLIGWYLWLAGHIFVDRADSRKAIASLDAAALRIRNGISIVVYPEGTRSPDGRILPFKKGPFALALKAGVAVVPVTIEGSGKLMPKNSWDLKGGLIRVKIGKPIDPTQFAENDREGLARAVRSVIIDQSVQLGGLGGDKNDAVAARGQEGIGKAGV